MYAIASEEWTGWTKGVDIAVYQDGWIAIISFWEPWINCPNDQSIRDYLIEKGFDVSVDHIETF